MLGKSVALSTILSVLVLWLMFTATTPASAGPVGILIIFILLYVSSLGVMTFLLFWISSMWRRLSVALYRKPKAEVFTLRKAYYYASVIALSPVMMVAMQSVNEVGIYQLLLVALFVAFAWLYITKRVA